MKYFSITWAQISEHSPRWPSLLSLIASLGVPNITLIFGNFLEGLTELTERYYVHGYNLLQWKYTDQNQSREEIHVEEDSKSATFSFALSIELWTTLTPLSNDAWPYAQSTANQGSPLKPWCPESLLGSLR